MFAAKSGSLRKALYGRQQRKSDSSTGSTGSASQPGTPTTTDPPSAQKKSSTSSRPPHFPIQPQIREPPPPTPPLDDPPSTSTNSSENGSLSPNSDTASRKSVATMSIQEGRELDTSQAERIRASGARTPTGRSSRIPPLFGKGRTRVKSANTMLGFLPGLGGGGSSCSSPQPDERLQTRSPLSVDVNCVCEKPSGGSSIWPSGLSLRRKSQQNNQKLLGAPLSGPVVCQVHNPNHHRSNSASPQVIAGITLPPGGTGSPLLIPMRGHRSSTNSSSSTSASLKRSSLGARLSPNVIAQRIDDHPTVFDFEHWHTDIDPKSQEAVYSLFMKAHKCYDIIPTSSKLVVFDTELPVSKAFFALVYNGVRAAPLYDSKTQDFVGMLTITDFIQILNKYYKKDSVSDGIKELEQHKISTWRGAFEEDGNLKTMVTIDPSESLYRAVEILCERKIHRLPVLEPGTGNILYILTHKRLIKFLFLYLADLPRPPFMDTSPKELGIGSWGDISAISKNTPLIEALKILLEKRVSALPILDENGRVIDVYSKFDAINLAADKTYNDLDVTVHEALNHRSDWFEGVRSCLVTDSLTTVIDVIVKAEVHRLIVTDDDQRVVGIISLSDILKHLVLEPPGSQEGTEETAEPPKLSTDLKSDPLPEAMES